MCGRVPSDPHHLTFTQPRALGRRVSDEFIVPVCQVHHRELHRSGNEAEMVAEAQHRPNSYRAQALAADADGWRSR